MYSQEMASGPGDHRRQHHRADRGPRHHRGYGDVDPAASSAPPAAADSRGRSRDYGDDKADEFARAYRDEPAASGRRFRSQRDEPQRDEPGSRWRNQPEDSGGREARRPRGEPGREARHYRDDPAEPRREARPHRDEREVPRRGFRPHRDEAPESRSELRPLQEEQREPRREYRSRRDEAEVPRRGFRPHREDPAEESSRETRPYRDEGRDVRTPRDEPGRPFRPSRDEQEESGRYARRYQDEPSESGRAKVHRLRRQRHGEEKEQTPPLAAEEDGEVERETAGGDRERGEPPGGPGLFRQESDDLAGVSDSSSLVDLEMVQLRHPRGQARVPRPQYDPPDSPQPESGQRLYTKRHNPRGDYPAAGGGGFAAARIGSMGPVQKAVRASAYSTLSVKSWSELDTEVTLVMRDLNKHFKPLFDKHGSEGMQVQKLRDELNSRRSQHLLGSRDSILERLRYADKDGDDYLSYGDFVIMITQDLKQERKMAFRGMLLSTLGSIGVLPKRERDDFLSSHKFCPPPLFIPIITIIQVIIFAVYVAEMEKMGLEVTASSGYPAYSPLPYSPTRRYEAWRFLTYMFIHDGYLHILYNVVSQVLFGFPLELVHGWWRTAIIYITGVTAGSLAHSVVDCNVGLVGASGGVYAILGAHLAAVVTNWKEMNYKLCDQEEFDSRPCCAISRFFVSAPFRLALVGLIVVPDTGLAIFRRVALDEDSRIGVTAHVGGFLTGLFLGIPVLKNVNRHAWETNLGWITLVVFLLVCAFAVFFNSFYDEYYPETDWS